MQSLNKIKTFGAPPKPSDIVKEKYNDNLNRMPIVFTFKFFAWDSIKDRDFNNYYTSKEDSRNQAEHFLDSLKVMSNLDTGQLVSNEMKKSLRFKEIRDETSNEIDRIEKVLKKYRMSPSTIEDFERSYHEFSINDGMRVICVKEDNMLHLLFIDNNHMICQNSARFLALKQLFSVPCIFDAKYNNIKNEQSSKEQIFDMAIAGDFESIDEMRTFYEDWKKISKA